MNTTRKVLIKFAAPTLALVGAAGAHAEVPAAALTAITTYGTDVVTAITALILAGIAIFAAKKLGSKMGWL